MATLLLGRKFKAKKAAAGSSLLRLRVLLSLLTRPQACGLPAARGPTGRLLEVSALAQLLASALCPQPCLAPSEPSSRWERLRTRLCQGIKMSHCLYLRVKTGSFPRHQAFVPGVHQTVGLSGIVTGRGETTLGLPGHGAAIHIFYGLLLFPPLRWTHLFPKPACKSQLPSTSIPPASVSGE